MGREKWTKEGYQEEGGRDEQRREGCVKGYVERRSKEGGACEVTMYKECPFQHMQEMSHWILIDHTAHEGTQTCNTTTDDHF